MSWIYVTRNYQENSNRTIDSSHLNSINLEFFPTYFQQDTKLYTQHSRIYRFTYINNLIWNITNINLFFAACITCIASTQRLRWKQTRALNKMFIKRVLTGLYNKDYYYYYHLLLFLLLNDSRNVFFERKESKLKLFLSMVCNILFL